MSKIVTVERVNGRIHFGVDGNLVSFIAKKLLELKLIKRETAQVRKDVARAIVSGHNEIGGTDGIEICWYGKGRAEIVRFIGSDEVYGDELETIAKIRCPKYENS